ncbi:hypothetical protein AVEN_206950-1, partial [Araneus ventricosus]
SSRFFVPISVQTEFQPPQAIWLISIDFDGCFLLAFQNIQFICEVNGPLKPLPPPSAYSRHFYGRAVQMEGLVLGRFGYPTFYSIPLQF